MPDFQKTQLLECSFEELRAFFVSLGEAAFRSQQVWQWIWQKGARDFQTMSNVAKPLRATLAERAALDWPEVATTAVSKDGTVKFLLSLADGARIETVLIPEKDHVTQCLSTQVGCAMGCAFCATGRMGFERNLTSGEILSQILVGRDYLARQGVELAVRNLVFMGMGEPLLNLDNLLRALDTLTHPLGLDFSSRRLTVSTVGLPKPLERLGQAGLASLAVSLHAPTQELRERLMPKAARIPLDELMAALDAYPLKPRQRITYEYILIKDVNDGQAEARQLVRLLGQRKAKVNLIHYNPSPSDPAGFEAPGMERVLAFENLLKSKGVMATLRKSKGQDIAAACGQLKAATG
jgi:23S rRNA (adenine2503-C2)-methyltransferase